tara:strand:+ start:3597 stop:6176 length:2580 start_codon:yes stop_codon:yes gene_type:complete
MSNKIFYSSPRARFFDNNGNPLSNGRVSFYEAGTTTLKTIYTDITQTTPAQNPALLDADGYVRDQGIWLGGGRYKFKLEEATTDNPDVNENADFALLWTMDNIEGASVLNSGELSTVVVATIADMVNLTAGEYSLVYVAGYWAENDGGGGWFNYDPNDIEPNNGGTVIAPSGSPTIGRYLRNLENWEVSVQYFGATSTAPVVVGSYCQNALTWCLANDRTLVFPADTYTFGSSQTFQGNLTIKVKEHAVFTSEGVSIQIFLTPSILEVEGKTNHLGDNLELYFAPTTPTTFRPEHWGAVGFGGDSDADFKGFINADGKYADSILVLSGDYEVNVPVGNPTVSFSTQRMHIELGATLTTDLEFNIGSYTFADNLNSVWTFPKNRLKSLADPVLYLDHFAIVTPISDADFTYFKDAVTDMGSRHGSFKLLTGGDYPVFGITATPLYSMDLFIKVGNNITAVSESELPRIVNGDNDFNILDANGANIKLSNNRHSVVWWGASSSTNSAITKIGIANAIQSASLSSSLGLVTGNNENLTLVSENLTITNPNVELRDFKFSNTSGFGIIFVNGIVKGFNCSFVGLQGTTGSNYSFESCKISGDSNTTLSADILEFSRCKFTLNSSNTVTLQGVEELYYEGNRSSSGRFNFTTGSSTNVISNNRFNGLVRVGSGIEDQSMIILNGGSNTTITNNITNGVDAQVLTANNYVIEFVGLGQSVSNLVCKDNNFSASTIGTGQQWRGILVGGYANDGHSANVTENTIAGGFFDCAQTTRRTKKIVATAVTLSDSIPLIFPFYSSSSFVWVQGTSEGSAMLGTSINMLGVEITSVSASGGNSNVNYDYRIAEAGTSYANMKFSLQKEVNI